MPTANGRIAKSLRSISSAPSLATPSVRTIPVVTCSIAPTRDVHVTRTRLVLGSGSLLLAAAPLELVGRLSPRGQPRTDPRLCVLEVGDRDAPQSATPVIGVHAVEERVGNPFEEACEDRLGLRIHDA